MKKSLAIFLKILIVFVGIAVFAFLLWEPNIEGRNINSTLYQVYFNDPFLIFVYIASFPFFYAIFQAYKALGFAEQGKIFVEVASVAVRRIKYCAMTIIGFALVGEVIIMMNSSDDRAGGVFMGGLVILGSVGVIVVMRMLEKSYSK